MNYRGFVQIFAAIVIGLIAFVGIVFFKNNLKITVPKSLNKSVSDRSSNTITISPSPSSQKVSPKSTVDKFGLEPPKLPSEINWQKSPLNKQELNKATIKWFTLQPYFEKTGDINLSGTEWIAEKTYKNQAETQAEKDKPLPLSEYEEQLLNQGWVAGTLIDLDLGNYGISITGFAGVGGKRDGYLKNDGNNFRVVVVQFLVANQSQLDKYPITWRYKIFISQIFTKENLLAKIKE